MKRKITVSPKSLGRIRALKAARKITPLHRLPRAKAPPRGDIPVVTDAMLQQDVAANSESFDVLAKALACRLPAWIEERGSPGARAAVFLRTMRNAAGLSQVNLGELAAMKQSDISSLENGDGPQGPSFDVIARIADACGFYLTFEAKSVPVVSALDKAKAAAQVSRYAAAVVRQSPAADRVVRTYVMDESGNLAEFEGTSRALRKDETIILGAENRVFEVAVEAPKAKIAIKEAAPSVAAALQYAQSTE